MAVKSADLVATPVGLRLREIRKKKGLTQTELARSAGISCSYLNLIEHDKRMIGGALLNKLAKVLDVNLERISAHQDACLIHDMIEMAGDPLFRDDKLEQDGPQNIVGRQPNWGRSVLKLYHKYLAANETVEALSDRLNRDPFLAEARHEILSLVTSIRSFSEILQEYSDLSANERDHFISVLAVESGKLADTAKSLFQFMTDMEPQAHPTTPAGEVNDFIIDNSNFYPDLEDASDELRKRIARIGGTAGTNIPDYLSDRHNIRFSTGPVEAGPAPGSSGRFHYDAKARKLTIDEALPAASTRFSLAQFLFNLEYDDLLQQTVDHPRLTSDESRLRASQALARYGAGALLFPYDKFLQAAEEMRYDIEALGYKFGASFEQVCHRLITLRKPSAAGLPMSFLRVDPAGNISKRFSLPSLRMPSHIGACPLWAVYRALLSPEQVLTQLVKMPNNETFVFVARTVGKRAAAFGSTQRLYSVMIGYDAIHAGRTVYGDGLDPSISTLVTPVGTNCRLCPRSTCQHRAYAQIIPADPKKADTV